MKRLLPLLLVLALWVAAPLAAQGGGPPLDSFLARVVRLWAAGEAEGVAALVGRDGRITLELGSASGGVQERHAAAALRALFAERETVNVRPQRAAVSGGNPPRGFVELAWTFRARGARAPRTRPVYLGATWEDGEWRLRELRIRP